jgi:hypothetical protein
MPLTDLNAAKDSSIGKIIRQTLLASESKEICAFGKVIFD